MNTSKFYDRDIDDHAFYIIFPLEEINSVHIFVQLPCLNVMTLQHNQENFFVSDKLGAKV